MSVRTAEKGSSADLGSNPSGTGLLPSLAATLEPSSYHICRWSLLRESGCLSQSEEAVHVVSHAPSLGPHLVALGFGALQVPMGVSYGYTFFRPPLVSTCSDVNTLCSWGWDVPLLTGPRT